MKSYKGDNLNTKEEEKDYIVKDIRMTRKERREKKAILKALKIVKYDDKYSSGMVAVTRKERNSNKGFVREWLIQFLAAVLFAFIINKLFIFQVYIPSESMVPTLNVEDRLFVTMVYDVDSLERGDIVVFNSAENEVPLIKRLIGLPGDYVEIKDGIVSVNLVTLEENYLGREDTFSGSYVVPEGHYFFLGDNRYYSKDSRYFEDPYISEEDIIGKAQFKIYPFNDIGMIE